MKLISITLTVGEDCLVGARCVRRGSILLPLYVSITCARHWMVWILMFCLSTTVSGHSDQQTTIDVKEEDRKNECELRP